MDPNLQRPQGPLEGLSAMNTTEKANVNTPSVPTVMCAIQDTSAANAHQNMTTPPTAPSPPDQRNAKTDNKLPTPILIYNLENALTDHPHKQFVAQICDNLRGGARICFEGQRAPRFSRNLPTALADPNVVTQNLEHEISLGRLSDPFDTPTFPKFSGFTNWLGPKKEL